MNLKTVYIDKQQSVGIANNTAAVCVNLRYIIKESISSSTLFLHTTTDLAHKNLQELLMGCSLLPALQPSSRNVNF